MRKYETGCVWEGGASAVVASGGPTEGNRIALVVTDDPNEDGAETAAINLSPTKARELATLLMIHADRIGSGPL